MWGKDKSIPNKEAGKRQTQAIPPILSKAAAPRSREVPPTGVFLLLSRRQSIVTLEKLYPGILFLLCSVTLL